MRRWVVIGALCLTLVVAGCTAKHSGKQGPPLPPNAPKNLVQSTPQQFVQFMPVVNRYFYYRKKAVVTGDVGVLWQEYPELKQGTDKQAAINAEADVVSRYRSLEVIDGNVEPEHYARWMVQADGERAIVLVNGLELYVRKNFEGSGGQLQLLLYLERRNGNWTVVKTDETTLAEYHQALHSARPHS